MANPFLIGNGQTEGTALAQLVGAGLGLYSRNAKMEEAKERQLMAANVLQQALTSKDPSESYALYIQAQELSPEFVNRATAGLAAFKGSAGQQGGMTEYQKESLRLREEQQKLDRIKMARAEETNAQRAAKMDAEIARIQARIGAEASKRGLESIEAEEKDLSAINQLNSSIDLIDRMITHPGREAATGVSSVLRFVPGTDARTFSALLEMLQGQQFLNEVQKMKGMGALSENEGKKLAQAAASLDLGMPEAAFLEELNRIRSTLESARGKAESTLSKKQNVRSGSPVSESETVTETVLPNGVTEEDVQFTMKKYGVTREQVLQQLGGR